jgi:hypothetical protein
VIPATLMDELDRAQHVSPRLGTHRNSPASKATTRTGYGRQPTRATRPHGVSIMLASSARLRSPVGLAEFALISINAGRRPGPGRQRSSRSRRRRSA